MAPKKKKESGKWMIFLLVIFFLNIFNDVLPEGLGIGLVIIFVIIFNILSNKAKKQGTNIKEEGIKQFTNILHFVEENIQKSRDSASAYSPLVSSHKGRSESISIKKESMGGPSRKDESSSTSTVGGKDILGRKVNPMSLDGK